MNNPNYIPKILKINAVSNYKVSCLFNNGESRIIDLKQFFTSKRNFSESHPAYKLLQEEIEFNQVEMMGNTIGWKNTGIHSTDFESKPVFYPYDIDPIVLFEYSVPDQERSLNIGQMVKEARQTTGMTQENLAQKSGVRISDITQLENNEMDIPLFILNKIITIGLGKKLHIQINNT